MTDRHQLLLLYKTCFPEDPTSFWEWFFARVYKPENTLNLWEDGRIVASLQMLPCTMRHGTADFSAHYIYAAATLPAWRGRGLMAGLLERAAEEGRKRGHAFSVLITQEDSLLDYYARFGYQGRFEIAMRQPKEAALTVGQICRAAEQNDIPSMNRIYEESTEGMLHGARTQKDWLCQLDLFGTGAWVLEINGSVEAYAFADERGILEAVGSGVDILAAQVSPGKVWRTIPRGAGTPMGSLKPLREDVRLLMEQNPCFLNLMFN